MCELAHQIEEKYNDITGKDESQALKKKISELTLVRLNLHIYTKYFSHFQYIYEVFLLLVHNKLIFSLSAGQPEVETGVAKVSDQSRLSA